MYSLMVTAKLNNIDQWTWLADLLGTMGDHPASRLDAADAEAICDAVSRPSVRLVSVKPTEQHSALMPHGRVTYWFGRARQPRPHRSRASGG